MRICLTLAALTVATAAAAQDTAPDVAIAAALNQQGLLEYCAGQGHVSAEAAQVQGRVIASFPPPTEPRMTAEAYRQGQSGIVDALGIDQPIAQAAAEQGLSLSALCGQLAAAAEQAAAQLR
ncbi:hypothetical protein EYF88_07860 [Paracoccus sediminis]|uniref:Uncharacterized protein n=1 Tax=Paracoccus sediminis TaxID=1214787 RepID=A0A238WHD9_9RHOB|nr:hypothetical protein [Paracoccus sediminis]TBN50825.1 hypothetical protein EYF88_07860 [Paracoccus sediminis]SNR45982.1 hypothetical protein SAMN06265378_104210 [Paracoccus sediminis]